MNVLFNQVILIAATGEMIALTTGLAAAATGEMIAAAVMSTRRTHRATCMTERYSRQRALLVLSIRKPPSPPIIEWAYNMEVSHSTIDQLY